MPHREVPCQARVPALRSPDRPRLVGRVKAASGVARDGASASLDPADQPSNAAATKRRGELCGHDWASKAACSRGHRSHSWHGSASTHGSDAHRARDRHRLHRPPRPASSNLVRGANESRANHDPRPAATRRSPGQAAARRWPLPPFSPRDGHDRRARSPNSRCRRRWPLLRGTRARRLSNHRPQPHLRQQHRHLLLPPARHDHSRQLTASRRALPGKVTDHGQPASFSGAMAKTGAGRRAAVPLTCHSTKPRLAVPGRDRHARQPGTRVGGRIRDDSQAEHPRAVARPSRFGGARFTLIP